MEFETVRNYEAVTAWGCVRVRINGVVSRAFAEQGADGDWIVKVPRTAYMEKTMEEAVELIAEGMDDWYTITQAAERLVQLGAFDSPPSATMMGIWCREGRFPGAVKVRGKGGRGSGGAWRISAAGLEAFVEWRKGK